MDRSFPFINKTWAIAFVLVTILMVVMDVVSKSITELEPNTYFSTYATIMITMIGTIVLMEQEQVSKWNSFLIASGTDRSEFMRNRFVKTLMFIALSVALLTLIEIAIYGLNDNRVVLLILNVAASLVVFAIYIYAFCRMGMTIRSQAQMSGLIIVFTFFMVLGVSIANNITIDGAMDVITAVWIFVTSVIITIASYFACMRRIKRVDM